MKILVVDDDPIIRDLLRKTMEVTGFEDVTTAESAVEAAPMVSEADPPFDCIFADIRMPDIDGSYLCKWIRKQPGYETTPIIMITALAGKGDIDRSYAAGATDYITKPIDPSKLSFQLRLLSREKKQNGSTRSAGAEARPKGRDFRRPIRIGGFEGELEMSALENYLKTLSRAGLHEVTAFSFVIQDALKLHLLLPEDEFLGILRDTGVAITECVPAKDMFLAYAGYGAFVGVAQGGKIDSGNRDAVEKTIQDFLSGLKIILDDEEELGVIPFMSMPHRLAGLPEGNAVDVLYRLIGEAEERSGGKIKIEPDLAP